MNKYKSSKNIKEAFSFSLDDLDHIEDYGLKKKKLDRQFFKDEFDKQTVAYYKENPPIKVGDILYNDYKMNEDRELISLGTPSSDPLAICCIQPWFLPDNEARFISLNEACNIFTTNKLVYPISSYELPKGLKIYMDDNSNTYANIPNPYIGLNKINPEFLNTDEIFQEQKGWQNTDIILFEDNSNNSIIGDCREYHPETKAKLKWYIPSISELIITLAKIIKINESLKTVRQTSISSYKYWTSTLAPMTGIWSINTYSGEIVTGDRRFSNNNARFFLHMKVSFNYNKNVIKENFSFSLDDLDNIENLGLKKKKLDKQFFKDEYARQKQEYWKVNHPIHIGDVLYSNFTMKDGKLESLGDFSGKPIGVCCIEPYFLPDNMVRFMSLKSLKASIWCTFFSNEDLPTANRFLTDTGKLELYGYFASNKFYNGHHISNYFVRDHYISSPYDNGSTSINQEWLNNNLNDFNGKKNTEYMISKYKHESIFVNAYNYTAEGTNPGDWYIPTIAELGIMFAKYKEIQDILKRYGTGLPNDEHLWSSTQYSAPSAACISTYDGCCENEQKMLTYRSRAFLSMEVSPLFKPNK